tara:strand:+ start:4205 stop:5122 length:918 start_codon:yes stop_codon:yes gene_type:complete
MSEENTPQEAPQTEVTESQPSINLDSTVQVDGQEISIKELINTRDEVEQLKEYNEQARKLMSPTGTNDATREQAIRYLMTQEGYTPDDINQYINWTNEMGQEPEQQYEQPQYEEPQPQEGLTEEQLQQQYYQEQMMREQDQARMREIEARQSRIGTEMMKKEMSNAIDSTMASNDQISKLLGINEESGGRKDVIRQEVEAAMMASLRQRRASGENFNNSWFTEEAGKAAKTVYDKFSSVIGDPDKIQRAPETAAQDSLFNKPPVDPPKYERGDDMGKINNKTRDWTLDTLLRGAQEGAAGGESKA